MADNDETTLRNEFLQQRINRRKALSTMGKVAIGAGAVIVVGGVAYYAITQLPTTVTQPTTLVTTKTVSGEVTTVVSTVTEQPKIAVNNPDHLIIGLSGGYLHKLDPIFTQTPANRLQALHMYDRLFDYTEAGASRPKPWLVDTYTVSPDAKIWTLRLKSGVKFHNGDPLTAEDVRYTYARHVGMLAGESPGIARALGEGIMIETPDDLTVRFTLMKGNISLDYTFALEAAGIINSKQHKLNCADEANVFAKPGEAPIYGGAKGITPCPWLLDHEIGSGPYELVQFVTGEKCTMKRIDNYWAGSKPIPKQVTFLLIVEPGTRVQMLQKGDVDMLIRLPGDRITELVGAPGVKILRPGPSPAYEHLTFMVSGESPITANKKVRKALNYATPKADIIRIAQGGFGKISTSLFSSKGMIGYIGDEDPYPYDLDKAKSLLAEAGYPDGFEIDVLWSIAFSELGTAGLLIKESWGKIGVKMNLIAMQDSAMWDEIFAKKKFAACGVSTLGVGAPITHLPLIYTTAGIPSGWNNSFYSNPTVDGLLDKAKTAVSIEERDKAIADAVRIIIDDSPKIILFNVEAPVPMRTWINLDWWNPLPGPTTWSIYHMNLTKG